MTTRKTSRPKKAAARRPKGPPEDPMTKQVRKLEAIIQAMKSSQIGSDLRNGETKNCTIRFRSFETRL